MADKICGDGIGNSTGRLYNAEVDLITPTTMYGSSPGEPRTLVQSVDAVGPKKKPTSFQITSVTVQGSRLSNDGGDESADDLDESHTEDLSSDILDCSKTTDTEQLSPTEDNTPAIAPAPPAPTEAAAEPVTAAVSAAPSDPVPSGGLAAVTVSPAVVTGAAGTLAIVTGTPAAPSTTEGPINPDHWQRRFKVVKIVSSEPFGRGRWLCMDFVDPPAMQADAKAGEERDSGTAAADLPPAVSNEAVAHVYEIPVGQTYPANSQQSGPLYGIILPVSAGGQGASPLSVLQPIAEQQQPQAAAVAEQPPVTAGPPQPAAVVAPVPEQQPQHQQQPPPVAADAAAAQAVEPIPENATNKSATEEDSERFPGRVARVPSRLPFGKGGHKAKVHDLLLTSAGSTVAIDNKIEQAMSFEKVLVQNIQFGLSPSLTVAIKSIKRWRLVRAALPHVMHCCAALLYARKESCLEKLGAAETKLLYTLHWILLDAAEECTDAEHSQTGQLPDKSQYIFPITVIQVAFSST
ncbi:hypothetical protein HPB49_018560 [Dermacentor silvarum]|uniref:Uncharacterized protein n=1 Tax=Dermacentor silvarum TaxID=543639 RepID=A0ACB8DEU4_DERSI|nr:hypothetical protein HPB49_018560 [Dermacentor silvarum]